MLEELTAEAQEVLEEMWSENLIPFKLRGGMVTEGIGEYTIRFCHNRIYLAHVPLTVGISFREAVRVAVLTHLAKVSGPLGKSPQ